MWQLMNMSLFFVVVILCTGDRLVRGHTTKKEKCQMSLQGGKLQH